jgi:hypothetical protein
MRIKKISEIVENFHNLVLKKIAIYNLTSFHGTSANYLKSILEYGLQARKPLAPTSITGVYLTNDLERAAGYTGRLDKPIVL